MINRRLTMRQSVGLPDCQIPALHLKDNIWTTLHVLVLTFKEIKLDKKNSRAFKNFLTFLLQI